MEPDQAVHEHPNVAFVRASMQAFERGDLTSVRKTWAHDVVWNVAGSGDLAGPKQGADAIFGYLAELLRRSNGTFQPSAYDIVGNETHVVALFRNRAERESRRLDALSALLVHIRDGLVDEITELQYDQARWDRFWSG